MPNERAGAAFASGIKTVSVSEAGLDEVLAALRHAFGDEPPAYLLVFFGPHLDAASLVAGIAEALPDVPVAGCSTAGEISAGGLTEGGLVAVGFPRDHFDVVSGLIPEVSRLAVDRGSDAVSRLRAELASRRPGARPGEIFAISLIDGLCMREEAVVSALDWALGDIPLIGGSAGDGLAFRSTSLLHGGKSHSDAAVLLLIWTDLPFRVFKADNFEPTDQRLVVTASDPERRTVHELNAEVAAFEYATLVGLDPDRLSPFGFAAHPMVVRVGGEYFCRSLRSTNPDGSLSFYCAIDDGVVLTIARPLDLVSSLEASLGEIDAALGGADWILGFDCVLRRLDAQNRQVTSRISDLMRRHRVYGFGTYGEQYRSMHLNQTFTGIAFGRPREGA